MGKHVLITGGAGFIGSHVADLLLRHGHRVRALDSLVEQVHGPGQERPEYLDGDVELQVGDVRNAEAVRRALDGVDVVFHLAASVGVGQSMYRMADYVSTNNLGTAVLLEELSRQRVEKLVVASSMSIYGEGLYKSADGQLHPSVERTPEQLRAGRWEIFSEASGELLPVPTPETKVPRIASMYALCKYDQECMTLMVGQAYGIPSVALRFFNTYGTRQALSNPYTGVLAIFASRLLNNKSPLIYEDGRQQRDFVSVLDIAEACRLAMEVPEAAGKVFNIGSGQAASVGEVARLISRVLGREHLEAEISGKYRIGDIRNCFADISQARQVLGYQPRVSLEGGVSELAIWLEQQSAADRIAEANQELAARGLTI